jgi:hypothetical protein
MLFVFVERSLISDSNESLGSIICLMDSSQRPIVYAEKIFVHWMIIQITFRRVRNFKLHTVGNI